MATASESITCPVCTEQFSATNASLFPHILPSCGHSACSVCIKKILQQGNFHCPVCRARASLGASNIQAFPVNFMLKEMIESAHKECLARRDSEKARKLEDSGACEVFQRCAAHGRPLVFFCAAHEAAICSKCYFASHHTCAISDLDVAVENARAELIAFLGHLEGRVRKIPPAIEKIRKEKTEILNKALQAKQKIQQTYEEALAVVEQTKKQAESDLQESTQAETQRLLQQEKSVSRKLKITDELLNRAKIFSHSPNLVLIQNKKEFQLLVQDERKISNDPIIEGEGEEKSNSPIVVE